MMLLVKNFFKKLLGQSGMAFIAKYYQILAGLFTAVFLYILKERHDSKIKKETTKEIEGQTIRAAATKQADIASATESVLLDHVDNPLPGWDELSKEASGNVDPAKKKRILKKLRRKD